MNLPCLNLSELPAGRLNAFILTIRSIIMKVTSVTDLKDDLVNSAM